MQAGAKALGFRFGVRKERKRASLQGASELGAILVIGTADTKGPELGYLRECIEGQGLRALLMDVGVKGDASIRVDVSKHKVAEAARSSIADIIALGNENDAMTAMAQGASAIASAMVADGVAAAVVILGGSMGTDLALDVAMALPLGTPKVLLSTVAFSHMIPPERLAPDLIMMLWAGGLYGLNSLCRSALSQAAGAVCGAVRARAPVKADRPLVGVTGLGTSCLRYMVRLAPALEARGFEVAVFHATGMGGRAFETFARQGRFAAVFDFAIQEVTNHHFGSVISAGPDRLTNAGLAGVPQLVAPGAMDMIDVPGWRALPASLEGRKFHDHNRLLSSTIATAQERCEIARIVVERLALATAPVKLLLPLKGLHEWDRPGAALRDEAGMGAVNETFRANVRPPIDLIEIDAHINDDIFVDRAIAEFDAWRKAGVISTALSRPRSAAS